MVLLEGSGEGVEEGSSSGTAGNAWGPAGTVGGGGLLGEGKGFLKQSRQKGAGELFADGGEGAGIGGKVEHSLGGSEALVDAGLVGFELVELLF